MNLWRAYLWKEWREQRAGVVGVLLVVPLLFALAAATTWIGESSFLREALRPELAAAVGALLALLVIGAELLPIERRRDTLGFLERLPGSLSAAFRAKLVFFALTTVLAALYAALLAVSIAWLWRGTSPLAIEASGWMQALRFVLPTLGIATWVFAVSAWVPRGTMAFPAAVLCIAVLCWPAWLLFGAVGPLRPLAWEPAAFLGVCALGACVSAGVSFVHGARQRGSLRRAGILGLGTAALLLAPSWAWTALRIHAYTSVDPESADFHIQSARLGADGTRVELQACRELPCDDGVRRRVDGPTHTLLVDLDRGSWEPATGRVASAAPSTELTNGRPLQAEDFGLPPGTSMGPAAGFGFAATLAAPADERTGWFDPFTCQFVSRAHLERLGFARTGMRCWIGPSGWLVVDQVARLHYRWSPVDGRPVEALRSFSPGDGITTMLLDGRVLACGDGNVFVVDLATDQRQEVRLQGFETGCIERLHRADDLPGHLANGLGLPLYAGGPGWNALACFRGDTTTLRLTARSHARLQWLGSGRHWGESAIAIEDGRRIVRLELGGAGREPLFPRTPRDD